MPERVIGQRVAGILVRAVTSLLDSLFEQLIKEAPTEEIHSSCRLGASRLGWMYFLRTRVKLVPGPWVPYFGRDFNPSFIYHG
jgi:hypothetical protein